MQRLAHLSRSSSAKGNGFRVRSLFSLLQSSCASLPAAARRHPRQQQITGNPYSPIGFHTHHFRVEQKRSIETNRHVSEGVSERQPGDKPIGLLRGSPTFTPRKTDLKQNFLEVDPDNPTRLLEYFAHLLKHGNLEPSEAQKDLMKEMQNTRRRVRDGCFFYVCRIASRESPPFAATTPKKTERESVVLNPKIRGMYIYGGVGQGKTMILDAFFDCLSLKRKLRVHFHQFMLDVQQELHRIKMELPDVEDPLFEVARKISKKAQVLCFDEFQVVHITDAMIMKRLFEGLFSLGAIVVATSNRAPQELYLGGLNRERFLPFIPLLERCCKVYHIDTKKDYSLFYAPPRQEKIIFEELEKAAGGPLEPGEIQVAMGRTLKGPLMQGGFAAFTFAELCGANVGPSDYLALASRFHTVSLRNIPDLHQMDQHPNEIRRFISLIDVLYERYLLVLFLQMSR
ncbi:hypothetical protein Emag_004682 [Eimeria magna]